MFHVILFVIGLYLRQHLTDRAVDGEVGADAAAAGIDALVCVGPLARGIARGANAAGLAADRIACVDDAAAALAYVRPLVGEGDAVLVKASHSVGLERVVEGLVD